MRVRILKPLQPRRLFEPFDVSSFEVGKVFEVGPRLGELLLTMRFAELEPQVDDRAADDSRNRRDKTGS